MICVTDWFWSLTFGYFLNKLKLTDAIDECQQCSWYYSKKTQINSFDCFANCYFKGETSNQLTNIRENITLINLTLTLLRINAITIHATGRTFGKQILMSFGSISQTVDIIAMFCIISVFISLFVQSFVFSYLVTYTRISCGLTLVQHFDL